MAQWVGQFSNNTHGTKVADSEFLLRNAVEAFKTSVDDLKRDKAKTVKKLAGKVLNARLKMLKAKRSEIEPVESSQWSDRRIQIENLEGMITEITSAGVDGILREFEIFQDLNDADS